MSDEHIDLVALGANAAAPARVKPTIAPPPAPEAPKAKVARLLRITIDGEDEATSAPYSHTFTSKVPDGLGRHARTLKLVELAAVPIEAIPVEDRWRYRALARCFTQIVSPGADATDEAKLEWGRLVKRLWDDDEFLYFADRELTNHEVTFLRRDDPARTGSEAKPRVVVRASAEPIRAAP